MQGVELCEGDSREEIRAYLERNPGLSCVAEEDGTMAGAALCGHDGRRGFIYHLAVSPAYRGRGVGKLLLEDCVRGLGNAGLKRAIILVAENNSLGREFWLRNGWEDIAGGAPDGARPLRATPASITGRRSLLAEEIANGAAFGRRLEAGDKMLEALGEEVVSQAPVMFQSGRGEVVAVKVLQPRQTCSSINP